MQALVKIAQSEAKAVAWLRRSNFIATGIVFPTAIALWIGFHPEISGATNFAVWVAVLIFMVFLQCLFLAAQLKGPQSTQEVYHIARQFEDERNNLSEENDGLKVSISRLSLLADQSNAWNAMLAKYKLMSFSTKDDIVNEIGDLLTTLVDERGSVFGFGSQELWNFAVYLHDDRTNQLKPVWRKKDDRHPSEGLGRTWEPGQGHVGQAFANSETRITGDANAKDVKDLMTPPQNLIRPYDEIAYRSFASVPIGPISDGDIPLGVLVATSSQDQRFNYGNCLMLKHAAAALANFFHLNDIDVRIVLD